MDTEASTFIETLKDKYLSALQDEREAVRVLDRARRRKAIYGQTLVEEGINLAALGGDTNGLHAGLTNSHDLSPITGSELRSLFIGSESSQNGTEPLSDTHALYLTIRKYGNQGYTFAELRALSEREGYGLTDERVRQIFWKQVRSKRMEKLADGKIRLTAKGEKFSKFRSPSMPGGGQSTEAED